MTRRRPGNLDLTKSRNEKPAALRETGRDAFLPCKTPTSAGFFNRLKFLPPSMTKEEYIASLDANKYDEETRRNIAFLNSGSFYVDTPYGDHSHLAPPPPPSFAMSVDTPRLEDSDATEESEDGGEESAEVATGPMLIIDYMRQYAAEHGVWPKVSVFNDSFIPDDLFGSESQCADEVGNQSGENADAEADEDEEMEEDISPYFIPVPLPTNEEQGSSEIQPPASQYEVIPSHNTISAVSYEDAMSLPSSEEDNDNSDDEDFQDPSYERLQQQLHYQFSNSNSNSMPELSSPSSSSSRSVSPYPVTPKSSPIKRRANTKSKPRARAKPYSTDPSTRIRKASSGSDDDLSSPSPEAFDSFGDSRYTTFRCKKTGKMMFQCLTCPELQTRALGDMKRHLEGLKHQRPSYKCDPAEYDFGCGKTFTRTDALKRHFKSKHPMGWAILQCEREEQGNAQGPRGNRKGRA